ncbi:DUF502 domain-containing protein [Marinigracilibium pacificum]|uniref:DUF502 domain-containing protein n=1 Tax=Marinigracilibium pacificum TaxID=2729599 RepID=A0A848J0C6_9BACT|nr:DUF502 domain-containing protein [Marinigracilibium pacificum]NMM49111.1 DUF502 domain-containing protein [Marinigracilibium pacificum]
MTNIQQPSSNKHPQKKIIRYFFNGLLFIAPVAVTIYVIYSVIDWLDNLLPINIPGIGFISILAIITIIGYIGSTFISKPIIDLFEKTIVKIPLISLLFTSIKDLTEAFVGEKKKFKYPVLVNINGSQDIQRLGFITRTDLTILGLENKVAVYFPHSYNVSGNIFFYPKDWITRVDVSSSEAMKFLVSGGISGWNNEFIK